MWISKRTPINPLMIARRLSTLPTSNLDFDINNCLQNPIAGDFSWSEKIKPFVRNGQTEHAHYLFDEMTLRSPASWNTLLSDLNKSQNPIAGDFSWSEKIKPYVRNGQTEHAHYLFDEVTLRSPASWNTLLSDLNKSQDPEGVYKVFIEMGRYGFKSNEYTILTLVSVFSGTKFNVLVPQIHALVVCSGLNTSISVAPALMKWYATMGDVEGLGRVFDEISVKNVTCWNALVSRYMEVGYFKQARRVFDKMPERDIVSWTCLIDGYIRNKWVNKARSMFNKMPEKNVVSWTAMINGYVQHERFREALKLFVLMLRSDTRPNQFTFSNVLDACAGCSYLVTGQQVHSCILKFGIPEDLVLSASLVDMYAKCRNIDAAFRIFESTQKKSLVSWNSLIAGYARQGLGRRALQEFDRMISTGVSPNQVTTFNVLLACRGSGLVEEGERHFNSMNHKYGIQPGLEHYACMMETYGKAGQMGKAETLIKGMLSKFDVVLWGAFLRAFYLYSGLQPPEFATESILKLKRDYPAVYSAFRKIHGEAGSGATEFKHLKEMKKKKKKIGQIESRVK